MTQPVQYLELEDILLAAEMFLGRQADVRDYGLLESALARPKVTVFGRDAYPTLHEKAASLLDSLVNNHALIDGNKRLGWVSVRLFYGLNEYVTSASEDDKVDLVISIAEGRLTGVDAIAEELGRMFVRR